MNQILVTEKLYITPELKKKKKMYKVNFILSLIVISILVLIYIYSEYEKHRSEQVSQQILAGVDSGDTATIRVNDEILVIALDSYEDTSISVVEETSYTPEITSSGKYVASNGNTYSTVGKITIPSINVQYSILSKTTDELLKVSVCWYWGANPNEVGNLCIAGHNYRNKKFFSKVPTLKEGDIIEIEDLSRNTLKYEVYTKFVVDPNDTSCTSQVTNGEKRVTLITCTDDSKQRVIVQAREIKG